MGEPHDDLLQPTLDSRYDTSGLGGGGRGRPWNPSTLKFVTFFSWPLGAGALYGLNYRRLQQDRAALWTFVGTAVLTAAMLVAMFLFLRESGGELDRRATRTVRTLFTVVSLLCALGLSKHQSGPFRAYEMRGGTPQSLWLAGTLAVVLNMAVFASLAVALVVAYAEAE